MMTVQKTKMRYSFSRPLLMLLFALPPIFLVCAALTDTASSDLSELIVQVNIPTAYQRVFEGETMLIEAEIFLIRKNREPPLDVVVTYLIKNVEGDIIVRQEETKGAILRISTLKEIPIPSRTAAGSYTVEVQARYRDLTRKASASFEIQHDTRREILRGERYLFLATLFSILLSLFVFLVFLFLERQKFKRIEKFIVKVGEKHLKANHFVG